MKKIIFSIFVNVLMSLTSVYAESHCRNCLVGSVDAQKRIPLGEVDLEAIEEYLREQEDFLASNKAKEWKAPDPEDPDISFTIFEEGKFQFYVGRFDVDPKLAKNGSGIPQRMHTELSLSYPINLRINGNDFTVNIGTAVNMLSRLGEDSSALNGWSGPSSPVDSESGVLGTIDFSW